MKIAIQGHPTRGKEIISLLESFGSIKSTLEGDGEFYTYYIDKNNVIRYDYAPKDYKVYTLEEFETQFPFKVGDKVVALADNKPHKIIALENYNNKMCYKLDDGFHYTPQILKPYKEMKEERNITLTLEKAKEWYNKGGELKEIALQAFTEKELTKLDLPKTWEEFCINYPVQTKECWLSGRGMIEQPACSGSRRYKNWIPSKKSAEAHLTMMQLEQLRDCWRQGWKPEWNSSVKYAIKWDTDDLTVFTAKVIHSFLVFPTREMAEEFLECFRDLIEQAGDLV